MNKEQKDLSINLAYRFAEKFAISNYAVYDYERRGELLILIKEKDEQAYELLNHYYNTEEAIHIINEDLDYKSRNLVAWHNRKEQAQQDKAMAGRNLANYAQEKGVSLAGLFQF